MPQGREHNRPESKLSSTHPVEAFVTQMDLWPSIGVSFRSPLSVIDYVIVHELTHRRSPHHRPMFWDAVRVILPDFAARKQWLRDHGEELGR